MMNKKVAIFLGRAIFTLVATALLNGCYRMPDEDDCSIIPTTNNPHVTRERQGLWMPTVPY